MTVANIEVRANASQAVSEFERLKARASGSLAQLKGEAAALSGTLGLLGAGAAAVHFGGMIKDAIDAGDSLNKMAQRTGMGVESLSQWEHAAKLADVSNEAFGKGIKELNQSIAKSAAGDKEKIALFKALGVTVTDTSGKIKSTEQVLLDVADAYEAANDGAGKVTIGQGLMGKASVEMIPLLNSGSAAIKAMKEEANRLGITISADFAKQAEEFNDNVTRMETGSKRAGIEMASALLPTLQAVIQELVNAKMATGEAGESLATKLGNGLATAIEAFVVFGANVSFVLQGVGREIGGLWAQTMALKNFDFKGFNAISEAMKEDAAKARAELDALEKRILRIKEPPKQAPFEDGFPASSGKPKRDLKAPGAAAAEETEYQKLIKRIQERIAVQDAELKKGRELTEEEKFAVKALQDLDHMKKQVSDTEKARVKTLLAESAAEAEALKTRAREKEALLAQVKAEQDDAGERAAAQAAAGEAYKSTAFAIAEQTQALDESNQMQKLEASLLGATEEVRQQAIGTLKIQLDLQREEEKLGKNLLLNEEQRAAFRKTLNNNADTQRAMLAERVSLDEFQRQWQSIDTTAHDVFVNIFESGSNVFKKLGQTLKASLLDMLYQMTVRPWLLNIVAGVSGGGGVAGAAGGAVMQGGTNMLGSIGANALGLGAAGAAMSAGATGAGIAMAGGATFGSVGAVSAVGGYAATGAAIGTGATGVAGAAGSLAAGGGAALAAIPVAGWIALAALAVYSLTRGGEKRSGGQYENGALVDSPSGGEINGDATRTAIAATMGSVNSIIKTMGGTTSLTRFVSGAEESKNGKGFAYAGGTLSNGASFGQGTDGMGYMNRRGSMSNEEAAAALGQELKQATLQALQAADLKGALGDWLKSLGDIDALSDGALDAALGRINKAMTEKQQLEAQIFDLTATDLEKLNKTRDAERAAIDESNRALLEQVYALQDQKNAVDAATVQLEKARTSAASAVSSAMKAVQTAVAAEREQLASAYEATSERIRASIEAVSASVSRLSALSGTLHQAVSRFNTDQTLGMTRGDASAQIASALAIARATGVLPEPESLTDALNVVSQPSSQLYSSFLDYARAFDQQLATINELNGITDSQLTVDQRQLAALQDQQKAADRFYQQDLARLDGILQAAQAQVDALSGNTTVLVSVAQALALLQNSIDASNAVRASTATTATKTGTTGGGGSGMTDSQIVGMFVDTLGSDPTAAQIYALAYQNKDTVSLADLDRAAGWAPGQAEAWAASQGLPTFAAGGMADGTAMVGEVGPEVVDFETPGRVYTAAQTRGMFGSQSAIVEQLATLNARMQRIENNTEATAVHAFHLRKMTRQDQVDGTLVRTDADTPLQVEVI